MPAPTVTALSPASGPAGTLITLTGTGFTEDTSAVMFGAVSAGTRFSVVSGTQMTAYAPAGTGTVSVKVTTPGGVGTVGSNWTYDPYVGPPAGGGGVAPTVTSVVPSSAVDNDGGDAVVVNGTGFTNTTAVLFGTALAQFTVTSDTALAVTTPGGSGVVDVTVVTAYGISENTSADDFTYPVGLIPTITSFAPAATGEMGLVTITGTNFWTAAGIVVVTGVTFTGAGGVEIPAVFRAESATSLVASVPEGAVTGPIKVYSEAGSATAASFTCWGGIYGDIDPSRLPDFETYFVDGDPDGPPDAVTGLTGAAPFGSVVLSWDLPPEALWRTWEIFEGTTAGFTPGAPILTVQATVVQIVKDTGTGPWYYKVRAINSRGEASADVEVGPFTLPTLETVDLGPGSVHAEAMAAGAVDLASAVVSGELLAAKLADNAVTQAKLAVGSVDLESATVVGAIVAAKLADAAVTSAKIATGAVTAVELALSVTDSIDTAQSTADAAAIAASAAQATADGVIVTYYQSDAPGANIIPTMTSATAPSGVASESGCFKAAQAGWKAFDHSNVTSDNAWVAPSSAKIGWIQYQFPTARTVTRYAITSRCEYASPPKTWTFKGSNNGSTWVTLDTQTNITDWAATPNVRKVFNFANSTAYAYYRLDITDSNYPIAVDIGELEMMEKSLNDTSDLGALWFDTDGNQAYRWAGSVNGGWILIIDNSVAAALAAAQSAQATADGKIAAFYQASAPATLMDTGDLWFDTDDKNKPYYYSGSAWSVVRDGTIADAQAQAVTATNNAATADAKAVTADGKAVTAQSAASAASAASATADGKAVTAQAAAATASAAASTADGKAVTAKSAADAAAAAAATANTAAATASGLAASKAVVLYQTSAPGSTYQNSNTLWIDTTASANTPKRWTGSAWSTVTDKTATDAASAAATANTAAGTAAAAAATAAAAAATADGKAVTAQGAAATAAAAAATADGKAVAAQADADAAATAAAVADAKAVTAQAAAATADGKAVTAQTTANGKNTVIFSTSVASGTAFTAGDVWFKKAGALIVGQWEFVSGAWAARTIDSVVIANLDAAKITTGSLAAERIAAGTITGAKIATDTIVAGNIAAEAIGASEIAANSIFAKNLTMVDFDNLIPNANSEKDRTGKDLSISSPDVEYRGVVDGNQYAGVRCRRVAGTGGGTQVRLQLSDPIPVNLGDVFRFQGMAKISAADGAYGAALRLQVVNNSLDTEVESGISSFRTATTYGSPDTDMLAAEITITNPASAWLRPFLIVNVSAGVNGHFDNLLLRRKSNANLIVDGTITATQVNTASLQAALVTAAKVNTLALSADAITAGTLDVLRIGAGTITAAKLNVADVQASVVTAAKVNTLALSAGTIVSGTMDADRIAAGSIEAIHCNVSDLQAAVVTALKVNALALSADAITAGTLVAARIGAGSITTSKLNVADVQAGIVTAAVVNALTLNAITITGGSIAGTTITGGWIQTASSGSRAILSPANVGGATHALTFYNGATLVGQIAGDPAGLALAAPGLQVLVGSNMLAMGSLEVQGNLTVEGSIKPLTNWVSAGSDDGIWIQDRYSVSKRWKLCFNSDVKRLSVSDGTNTYNVTLA